MKTASSRDGQENGIDRGIESANEGKERNSRRRPIMDRIRTLVCSEEEGTQLVELALVAPIMVLMLTGLASFAMALYSYQQLGYATSSAAQQVGAEQGLITDPCATIESDVTTALPGWSPAKFTYTAVITDSGGSAHTFGPTTGSSFSCTSGAGDMALNEPMTLSVSYAYNWFSIFTWRPDNEFTPSGSLSVSEAVLVE
ncbi:MAG: TadE family protein [Terracidiphilus sp.]